MFSIAICRQSGDKWQSKTLFLTIFDICSSISIVPNSVSNDFWSTFLDSINVFDCRLSGVQTHLHFFKILAVSVAEKTGLGMTSSKAPRVFCVTWLHARLLMSLYPAQGINWLIYVWRRFKSVFVPEQSEQSLSFPPEETLGPWLAMERPSKTLIRLRGRAGWSESSMGAHANLYLMLDPGSYNFDPCHAEYFYVLHSSPIFMLQHSRCKHAFSTRVENTGNHYQIA